jgi:hypothetical protein
LDIGRGAQQRGTTGRGEPCSPHGPIMVEAIEHRAYVAHCLRCKQSGPKWEDASEAKRAFDEFFGRPPERQI